MTEEQQDRGTADCPEKGMLSFGNSNVTFKKIKAGLPWWLRTHLPVQGTWVGSLVWEDFICCGAIKPVHPNY